MGSKFRKKHLKFNFTPEQVEEMKRLYWSEGESLQFIANKHGCSVGTIQRTFRANGIPIRPNVSIEQKITKEIAKEERKDEAKKIKRRIIGVNI